MKQYRFDIFCAVLLMASIITANDCTALATSLILAVNVLLGIQCWQTIRALQKAQQKHNPLRNADGQSGIKAEDTARQENGNE